MPLQEMSHNFLADWNSFQGVNQNRSRTFFQYPVADSTEIVDEMPTAWQHGTCSPVDGGAAVELALELTNDKPLQNHT